MPHLVEKTLQFTTITDYLISTSALYRKIANVPSTAQ